jgi:membrane-associated protein
MDPQWLLDQFGAQFFWVSVAIVFVECGLLFPILPGDSLLFAVGLFIAEGSLHLNLVAACAILSAGAFLGNVVGYEIGRVAGLSLYRRDGRVIKQRYFDETHAFFERYGPRALVLGRFVPIVRTFITVVAGAGRMDRRHFFTWSGVGAVLWATGITLLGYFLGQAFPILKTRLELAMIVIVAVSVVPMAIELLRSRRAARAEAALEAVAAEAAEAEETVEK